MLYNSHFAVPQLTVTEGSVIDYTLKKNYRVIAKEQPSQSRAEIYWSFGVMLPQMLLGVFLFESLKWLFVKAPHQLVPMVTKEDKLIRREQSWGEDFASVGMLLCGMWHVRTEKGFVSSSPLLKYNFTKALVKSWSQESMLEVGLFPPHKILCIMPFCVSGSWLKMYIVLSGSKM